MLILVIGILELIFIHLRVDTHEKIQELISSQKGEDDLGRSLGLGPGKGQTERLKEW